MSWATADLLDDHPELEVADPIFRDFGGATSFCGRVSTIKAFEDNTLVRAALSEPADGRVLVVDGGGSLRCAMLGDNLGQLAVDHGWSGIVLYGCVRDAVQLAALPVGVKALATHPRKSVKRDEGQRDVPVRLPGLLVRPGMMLYADPDGIVFAEQPLHT